MGPTLRLEGAALYRARSWLKKAYGTRNSLSASGGLDDLRYFVSGNYDNADGVLPNDHEERLGLRLNLDLTPREEISVHFNAAYSDHTLSITHTGNSAMALPFNAFRQPNNSFGSSDPKVLSQLLDAEVGQENQHFTTGLTLRWTPTSVLTQELTVVLDRSAGLSSTLSMGAHSIATEADEVYACASGYPDP